MPLFALFCGGVAGRKPPPPESAEASESIAVQPGGERVAGRSLLLPFVAAALVGTALYFPTFRASFAFDDMDYLRDAAATLAGKVSYWSVVFRPQGEHFLPVLRILIHASARWFGTDALAFRLLIFVCHVTAAFLVGLIARRYLTAEAGVTAAFAYVAAGGFSSLWVWFPSGGSVPIGLVGITGALAALAYQDSLGAFRARAIAVVGVVLAALSENTLVPLLAAPALLDEYERRKKGGSRPPGLFAAFCLSFAAACVVLTSVYYERLTGNRISVHPRAAVARAVFLLLVAPFRYFFPGLSLPRPLGALETFPFIACLFGVVVSLAFAAALVLTFRRECRALTAVALLTACGSAGFIALVGLGRWKTSFEGLYDADRYFFPLLIPFSMLMAVLMHGIRSRAASLRVGHRVLLWSLLFATLLVELLLQRTALVRRISWNVYAVHQVRFRQLVQLGHLLSAASLELPRSQPPLEFPDTGFGLPDVHNHLISARFLLYVANRDRDMRIRLVDPPVPPRDERILNGVFDRWRRQVGPQAPSLSIVRGDLVDSGAAADVDFRISPRDLDVVGGFYAWEGVSRWMAERGELRLRMGGTNLRLLLATYWSAIHKRYPERTPPRITVALTESDSRRSVTLGVLTITADGIEAYSLPVPESFASAARGREVHLTLESDQTWRPIDVLPGSGDGRDLSIRLFRAALGD